MAKAYTPKIGSFQLIWESLKQVNYNKTSFNRILLITGLLLLGLLPLAGLITVAVLLNDLRIPFVIAAVVYGLVYLGLMFYNAVYLRGLYLVTAINTAKGQKVDYAKAKVVVHKNMWWIFLISIVVGFVSQMIAMIQLIPFIGVIINMVIAILLSIVLLYIYVAKVILPGDPFESAWYGVQVARAYFGITAALFFSFVLMEVALTLPYILIAIFVTVIAASAGVVPLAVLLGVLFGVGFIFIMIVFSLGFEISIAKRYLELSPLVKHQTSQG